MRRGRFRPHALGEIDVLLANTDEGIVGIGEVIDATGFEPHVVVNEVERLLREAYITGELQRLITGGDPRPWFLVNPLISEKGNDALETFASEKAEPGPSADPRADRWDAFISHASEDKANFVEGLARELMSRDLKVWYDDNVLEVGDSVRKAIDRGLRGSDFGIVVISRDFMTGRIENSMGSLPWSRVRSVFYPSGMVSAAMRSNSIRRLLRDGLRSDLQSGL